MKQYAIYIRVSTQKQGRSGLGLESQKKICEDFIHSENGNKIAEFMDVESGTHRDRRGLREAITFCQANKCVLVIAKLDRLCRDVEFCFRVVNTGIEIHFCDMPTINTLLLGVFASVAQYERELTSDRTKKALAAKKARGEELGGGSKKWREAHDAKSMLELRDEQNKRSAAKIKTFLSSRDTKAFVKCLQRVFPDACVGEPHEWNMWFKINTKGDNKVKILQAMSDMRDLDPSGEVFASWNFSDDVVKLQVKLATAISTLRKSANRYNVYSSTN